MSIDTIREKFSFAKSEESVIITPLGGCGVFGMNTTIYTYKRRSVIVDVGSTFAEPWMMGVSFFAPKIEAKLLEALNVEAVLLTHAHEDHIGALATLLKRKNLPVYGSEWTIEIAKRKLSEMRIDGNLSVVAEGESRSVEVGPFSVDFLPIPHSIPDARSLVIRTEDKSIFHTGDFKLDGKIVPDTLASAKNKVDLLLCDSTNADVAGFCPSESSVKEHLKKIIIEQDNTVFITTFASHIERIRIIAEICAEANKKLFIEGRSLANNCALATKFGKLKAGTFEQTGKRTQKIRNKVVIVTGCQGEAKAALSKIVNRTHPYLQVCDNDTVVFSSRTIPGNERSIGNLIDDLIRQNVKVVTTAHNPGIHVSGHGFREDIVSLHDFLNPKHFLPIHGNFSKLLENSRNISSSLIPTNGDVLALEGDKITVTGKVQIDNTFFDEITYNDMTEEMVLDRLNLARKGFLSLSGAYDVAAGKWRFGPELVISGVSLPQEQKPKLIAKIKRWKSPENERDHNRLQQQFRRFFERVWWSRHGKLPVTSISIWFL